MHTPKIILHKALSSGGAGRGVAIYTLGIPVDAGGGKGGTLGLVTTQLTRAKVLAAARKVINQLHSLLPPEIEPLPPLEIEE